MSDGNKTNIDVSGGGGWIALAILIVFFWGDPDLHDVLMAYLQQANY